jgi:twitching motility protein PilT
MVAQAVEPNIPRLEELNLPPVMEQLCRHDQGMILLAGMTGTGKTTTIAAMLDWINHHYRKHILTIEDPIEYVFLDRRSLINQREIGESVRDFAIAMKHAVREDPDVILVGEMRDSESFSTALHAAETGHLVFGTIHAKSAATTVGRILDLFPQPMHKAIRSSMAFNMKAIMAQKLLATVLDKPRRVPIVDVMTFTPTIRKLILEGEDDKLQDALEIGRAEGMQTFDDSLYDFVERGYLDRARALEASENPDAFKMRLKGIDVKASGLL